jgi:hypothetical protein
MNVRGKRYIKRGPRCAGMLRSVCWQLFTDVSVQSAWAPLPLKMGPIDCPEASVNKYQPVTRNNHVGAESSYTPQRQHKISQVLLHFVNVDVEVKRGSEELSNMCSHSVTRYGLFIDRVNSLNAELNPICHLLTLLGTHRILHVSRIRINPLRLF